MQDELKVQVVGYPLMLHCIGHGLYSQRTKVPPYSKIPRLHLLQFCAHVDKGDTSKGLLPRHF